MGQSWGIIVTITIFGVGQLAALGVLIFHIGRKDQKLVDLERRVGDLETVRDTLVPAVAKLQGRDTVGSGA